MSVEIGILPSGHLHCFSSATDVDADESAGHARIGTAVARHVGEGLFVLAPRDNSVDGHPSLIYWRNFACKYLSARRQLASTEPSHPDPIEPLSAADTTALLLGAPPMRGAEYLSAPVLEETWTLLDTWVCEEIPAFGSLAGCLKKRAPQWHQIGRVCFHLAENKNEAQ